MNQLFINSSIWLIAHGKIQPGLFIYNALFMRKDIKACLSVIGAHSAFPKAAEAHLAGGQVDNSIIDASAAEAAAGDGLACSLRLGGEDVKSQWMRHGIYCLYTGVKTLAF